jgi:small-conductance mechanosensitive channel
MAPSETLPAAVAASTSVQVARPVSADELTRLFDQLIQPSSLLEMGVVLGCLALSWLLVRLWRGRQADPRSIWFGHHIVDGVLFPVLSLALALLARRLLIDHLPMAVFRVAIPVLVSLAGIRLSVKALKVFFPTSGTVVAFERTVSWLAWIGTILWVTGILPLLLDELSEITWKIGATTLSLRNVVEGTVSAILVLMLSLSLSSAIEARLLKGATDNLSLRKIAANAIRAMLLGLGLMLALSAAGVDLTALSVLGGAVGVGLGFGLQKLAANYVSGFVILAERSLRIGDLVKVDTFEGRITDINTRYTVLRAANGREAIVPNELLITQRVENASLADNRLLLSTVVQVAYGTDLDTLMPRMAEAVAAVPRIDTTQPPVVLLTAFAADGLELTVNFWVLDPENGQQNVRSAVNLTILRLLDEAGVDIPFAHRVVQIKS